MRILMDGEVGAYAREEVGSLPESVLRTLAVDGGLGKGNLLRCVRRSLPESVEVERVGEWVDTVISYLVTRGDLQRVTETRYVVPPSYAVETVPDGRSGVHRIRLHGDIRGDGRVLSAATDLDPGAHISRSKRDALATDEVDEADRETAPRTGALEPDLALVDRTLCMDAVFADERRGELVALFRESGCTLFSLVEAAESLPSVHDLTCPSERHLKDAQDVGGVWEAYVPGESWIPIDNWPGQGLSLVRRLVSDGSEDGFRYHYHGGDGRVARIDREEAALWRHYLNGVRGCEEYTVYSGGNLHVPPDLPPSARRWLEAVVGRRVRRARGYERLDLPERVSLYVQDVFEKSLGIKARRSFPKRRDLGGRRGR